MIVAILQARVSSSRLPGKVIKPILGEPMIVREIERIQSAKRIDRLVLATSDIDCDDVLEKISQEKGIACFRGDLNNVLDRFYHAARTYDPTHVVRLTGDCPLIDPDVIDEVISFHLKNDFDYTSNTIHPTFPDGLDVEIFRFACLEEAWREASLPSQLEHVTPFIHSQPDRYRLGSYENENDLSSLRWTVDEAADFEFVHHVYESLFPENPQFDTLDVLRFIERNPEYAALNKGYKRNEGYLQALKLDQSISLKHRKGRL